MMPKFDYTCFNEAFLYLTPKGACWTEETEIFPPEEIDNWANKICKYAKNPFAKTFTDKEHLTSSFKENLQFTLFNIRNGEKLYRENLEKGNSQKAVTRAREDLKHFMEGIDIVSEGLSCGGKNVDHYLENLRKPCRETTLRLLNFVPTKSINADINYTAPFTYKPWPPEKITAMREHIGDIHAVMQHSVTPGGSSANVLSPVMSQMIWELTILYWKYAGKAPGRSVKTCLIDTADDVKTSYVEGGVFKSFCLAAIKMVEDQLPSYSAHNQALLTDSAIDKGIRKSIKSLNCHVLTGP